MARAANGGGRSQPGGDPATSEFAAALLQNSPAQVGGMVTSVILVGQAFARFDPTLALGVAFLFALLLALYHAWLVQKVPPRHCFVVVPIAALILFALALGGNNSITLRPESTRSDANATAIQEVLKLKEEELAAANALIARLRTLLAPEPAAPSASAGADPAGSSRPLDAAEDASNRPRLRGATTFATGAAGESQRRTPLAQAADAETRRRQALEQLRAYEERQRQLQQEQRRLQEEQERLRREQTQTPTTPWQWRKW